MITNNIEQERAELPLRVISVFFASILVFWFFCSVLFSVAAEEEPLYSAYLPDNYSDRAMDVDQDGKYEFLTIEVGVDVQTPDEYSVMGYLYDINNKLVDWTIDPERLDAGNRTMHLDFDGKAIRAHGVDGPYSLKNLTLINGSSDAVMMRIDSVPMAYNTSFYNSSDFMYPVRTDNYFISGSGSCELLMTISIKTTLPVFSGKYILDINGINIPPFSSGFNVQSSITGYAYDTEGIYLPNKPNNFTVSARGVKNINVGIKKLQGSYQNSSMVWKAKRSRIWVTTQIPADNNGVATANSDLLSPGNYHAKIFGDAADNVSQVELTLTMVKKLIMKGRFNLGINTTGFPAGNYSITATALNGSLSLNELEVDGLSIAN